MKTALIPPLSAIGAVALGIVAALIGLAPERHPDSPRTDYGDGTYIVGDDIGPGTYATIKDGKSGVCYYALLNDLNDRWDSFRKNDISSGPMTVQVTPLDYAVRFKLGCTWHRTS